MPQYFAAMSATASEHLAQMCWSAVWTGHSTAASAFMQNVQRGPNRSGGFYRSLSISTRSESLSLFHVVLLGGQPYVDAQFIDTEPVDHKLLSVTVCASVARMTCDRPAAPAFHEAQAWGAGGTPCCSTHFTRTISCRMCRSFRQ